MTEQQILTTLNRWRDAIQSLEVPMDGLLGLFAGNTDGPLPDAIYALQCAYTAVIAERIGCCPDMLTDWWLTHLFGADPMHASVGDGPLQELESNEDLARFIVESNRANGE